jgi:hypothetical protein
MTRAVFLAVLYALEFLLADALLGWALALLAIAGLALAVYAPLILARLLLSQCSPIPRVRSFWVRRLAPVYQKGPS